MDREILLPVMDGWNHYYAISYLAERAGIDQGKEGFRSLVPLTPFDSAPCDHSPYFLPLGRDVRPWTPRGPIRICDMADMIGNITGSVLQEDTHGVFQYVPAGGSNA